MFLHLPGVLTPIEIAQAQQWLSRAAWTDGRSTAGPQAAQAKRNQQVVAGCPQLGPLQALVLGGLNRHALFFTAALPRQILPAQFNRYADATNTYGDHVDQAIRYHPASGAPLRADISCTLFLNEPEDYEGGELVALGPQGEEHCAKGRAGSAVLYPGHSLHRVEPVTQGERLASFFWVQSLVRCPEQRGLLFSMDQALMQLRQSGETPASVALTGSYHHLLRLWAET